MDLESLFLRTENPTTLSDISLTFQIPGRNKNPQGFGSVLRI